HAEQIERKGKNQGFAGKEKTFRGSRTSTATSRGLSIPLPPGTAWARIRRTPAMRRRKRRCSVPMRISWYRAEAQTRRELFIGNCYAVAPRRAVERFGGHGGRASGRSAPGSPARAVAPRMAAARHGAGVRAVGVWGPALQVPGRVGAGGEAAAVGRPDRGGAARLRLP
ncbi:unnamed protein product, partial [Urochloa humidicola]